MYLNILSVPVGEEGPGNPLDNQDQGFSTNKSSRDRTHSGGPVTRSGDSGPGTETS